MDRVLEGFTSELVKLSSIRMDSKKEEAELKDLYRSVKQKTQRSAGGGLEKLRGKGREVSRDYLASTLIGATTTPAAFLLGSRLARSLHNREVMKMMRGASKRRRRALMSKIESGPLIGGPASKGKPLMTRSDMAAQAVRGGLMGSAIQMLRDRFSGSAGV